MCQEPNIPRTDLSAGTHGTISAWAVLSETPTVEFIMWLFPVTPPIKECHRKKQLMVTSSLYSLDLGMMQGWKVNAEMFRFHECHLTFTSQGNYLYVPEGSAPAPIPLVPFQLSKWLSQTSVISASFLSRKRRCGLLSPTLLARCKNASFP